MTSMEGFLLVVGLAMVFTPLLGALLTYISRHSLTVQARITADQMDVSFCLLDQELQSVCNLVMEFQPKESK